MQSRTCRCKGNTHNSWTATWLQSAPRLCDFIALQRHDCTPVKTNKYIAIYICIGGAGVTDGSSGQTQWLDMSTRAVRTVLCAGNLLAWGIALWSLPPFSYQGWPLHLQATFKNAAVWGSNFTRTYGTRDDADGGVNLALEYKNIMALLWPSEGQAVYMHHNESPKY